MEEPPWCQRESDQKERPDPTGQEVIIGKNPGQRLLQEYQAREELKGNGQAPPDQSQADGLLI